MTPTKEAKECPYSGCDAQEVSKSVKESLTETNRVLVDEMGKIQALQVDHRDLQQKNLDALQEQSKHNVLLERFLRDMDKQDSLNDKIFEALRDLTRSKVETVDFKATIEAIKLEAKSNIDILRTDGKWFIGVSLSVVTIVLSLVVILIK